jgi:hypothetical protein
VCLQSFLKFRVEFGLLDNWLVSENELMNFVSYLYKRGVFLGKLTLTASKIAKDKSSLIHFLIQANYPANQIQL